MHESGKSMHVSCLKVSTLMLAIQLFWLFTVLKPDWLAPKIGKLVTMVNDNWCLGAAWYSSCDHTIVLSESKLPATTFNFDHFLALALMLTL